MPKTISYLFIASIYCLCVSVLGIINLFFEETGILPLKRSLIEISLPSVRDLTA
ncbi:hypothetical protein [Dissulfurispira thermophila]|uniref:hypothetical protein n=1 Tax=Dissulfurispira thermophila TaxID=2715679 RepID=UPI001F5BF186|nr:hypothetical protein [Dissulfurispira thermophila]